LPDHEFSEGSFNPSAFAQHYLSVFSAGVAGLFHAQVYELSHQGEADP